MAAMSEITWGPVDKKSEDQIFAVGETQIAAG
jgi:hypothetical protein